MGREGLNENKNVSGQVPQGCSRQNLIKIKPFLKHKDLSSKDWKFSKFAIYFIPLHIES